MSPVFRQQVIEHVIDSNCAQEAVIGIDNWQ
jgi:hypothetical protein